MLFGITLLVLVLVCFDIETSGTYGAANGDSPAEITEIGAVKVVNGKIVDQQDWLCNPGRKITRQIERLTHITNEKVAAAPPVSEGIKSFQILLRVSVLHIPGRLRPSAINDGFSGDLPEAKSGRSAFFRIEQLPVLFCRRTRQ